MRGYNHRYENNMYMYVCMCVTTAVCTYVHISTYVHVCIIWPGKVDSLFLINHLLNFHVGVQSLLIIFIYMCTNNLLHVQSRQWSFASPTYICSYY